MYVFFSSPFPPFFAPINRELCINIRLQAKNRTRIRRLSGNFECQIKLYDGKGKQKLGILISIRMLTDYYEATALLALRRAISGFREVVSEV